MSERSDEFVARCLKAVREIKDPAELQRQLAEMVEQDFPVSRPVFTTGETLPMYAFVERYMRDICKGVVPSFYDRPVTIVDTGADSVLIAIRSDNPKSKSGPADENPKSA